MNPRDLLLGFLAGLGLVGGAMALDSPQHADKAFAPEGATCPAGWERVSSDDAEVRVESCRRQGWQVFLKPVIDGSGRITFEFDWAWRYEPPYSQRITNPAEVPGWLP